MNLQEMIDSLKFNTQVQVLKGLEAYELPLMLRVEERPKVVKQLINQDAVPAFHELTGSLVKEIISRRVEYGITMKNLLTYADPVKEIEKSNSATLKESRMLPKSFRFNLILAIYDDYVAVTKLDTEDCFGYVVKDKVTAASFEAVFDVLWGQGKLV
jgi:hypothetical protein